MFYEDHILVQQQIFIIDNDPTYTLENIPPISNLREVVKDVLDKRNNSNN